MKFSEQFRIVRSSADDWFDPFLHCDTSLFVDPFLIFREANQPWAAGHARLIDFFNVALSLVAKSGLNKQSAHWRAAERLFVFPEPAEFCLGFAVDSTRGAGSGAGLRQGIIDAARHTIAIGRDRVEHFEELTLFGEQIGADRISDIVCNVLKAHFIRYTQGVATRHGVPVTNLPVRHADWDARDLRWVDSRADLPQNPNSGLPVLLTPARFLRELPTVDASDFWDWSWTNENETIRGEFNYEIGRRVDAHEIARLARKHPDLVRSYLADLEAKPAPPYDLIKDVHMKTGWYDAGATLAGSLRQPLEPTDMPGFLAFIEGLMEDFGRSLEDQDAWRLLWDDGGQPRSESIVQNLFRSVAYHYCRANDIDLSPESNAGRGPVDFKFSRGWSARALVEVKLTSNSRYWHGLQQQTPTYMRAERVDTAYFMSVGFRDADFGPERMNAVRDAATRVSRELGVDLRVKFVDARRKQSASKVDADSLEAEGGRSAAESSDAD